MNGNQKDPSPDQLKVTKTPGGILLSFPLPAQAERMYDVVLVDTNWGTIVEAPKDAEKIDNLDLVKLLKAEGIFPTAGDYKVQIKAYVGKREVVLGPIEIQLTNEDRLAYKLVKTDPTAPGVEITPPATPAPAVVPPTIAEAAPSNATGASQPGAIEKVETSKPAVTAQQAGKPANGNGGTKDRRQHVTPPLKNTIGDKLPAGFKAEPVKTPVVVPAPKLYRIDRMGNPNRDGLSLGIEFNPTVAVKCDLIGKKKDVDGNDVMVANESFEIDGRNKVPGRMKDVLKKGVLNPEGDSVTFTAIAYDASNNASEPGVLEVALSAENVRNLLSAERAQAGEVERQELKERLRRLEEQGQQGSGTQVPDDRAKDRLWVLEQKIVRLTALEQRLADIEAGATATNGEVGKIKSEVAALKTQLGQLSDKVAEGFKDSATAADLRQKELLAKIGGGSGGGQGGSASSTTPTTITPAPLVEKPRREWNWPYGLVLVALLIVALFGVGLFLYFGNQPKQVVSTPNISDNTALTELARMVHASNDNTNRLRESLVAKERAAYTPPPLPPGVTPPVSGVEPPKGAATATAPQAPTPTWSQPPTVVTQIVNVSSDRPSMPVHGGYYNQQPEAQRDVVMVRPPPQPQTTYQQPVRYYNEQPAYQNPPPAVLVTAPQSNPGYLYDSYGVREWSDNIVVPFVAGVAGGVVGAALSPHHRGGGGGHTTIIRESRPIVRSPYYGSGRGRR